MIGKISFISKTFSVTFCVNIPYTKTYFELHERVFYFNDLLNRDVQDERDILSCLSCLSLLKAAQYLFGFMRG
ncbi:MAG: hypothetical protein DPW20_04725 [Candidatus Brocadia sp.]|nr:MAG: hypothetical protein EDM70_03605 [Candidatus Brocadia sp. AMX2]MBC6931651.1 hypothetical protein [Candidatus Brocadia sp.]MCQ3916672.1 hypothetical protein [Candidatus Brocadia sp.]